MTKFLISCMVIFLVAKATMAEEKGCPAKAASEQGFTAVGTFHHALMPLWHTAWPEKDYEALRSGATAFDSLLEPIQELKPRIGNKKRLAEFETSRVTLAEAIANYKKAATANDNETMYGLLPGLHDSFEAMANALSPTPFLHFEGLIFTSDIILKKHIPNKNIEGITGSTETLMKKLAAVDSTVIPEELLGEKEKILQSFAKLSVQAGLMKESCDSKDMKAFTKHATEFSDMLKHFSAKFL